MEAFCVAQNIPVSTAAVSITYNIGIVLDTHLLPLLTKLPSGHNEAQLRDKVNGRRRIGHWQPGLTLVLRTVHKG